MSVPTISPLSFFELTGAKPVYVQTVSTPGSSGRQARRRWSGSRRGRRFRARSRPRGRTRHTTASGVFISGLLEGSWWTLLGVEVPGALLPVLDVACRFGRRLARHVGLDEAGRLVAGVDGGMDHADARDERLPASTRRSRPPTVTRSLPLKT